jgi:hypothetical protein
MRASADAVLEPVAGAERAVSVMPAAYDEVLETSSADSGSGPDAPGRGAAATMAA